MRAYVELPDWIDRPHRPRTEQRIARVLAFVDERLAPFTVSEAWHAGGGYGAAQQTLLSLRRAGLVVCVNPGRMPPRYIRWDRLTPPADGGNIQINTRDNREDEPMHEDKLEQARGHAVRMADELGDEVAKVKREWSESLEKGWSIEDATNFYGTNAVRTEEMLKLYRLVVDNGADEEAWARAYMIALRTATARPGSDQPIGRAITDEQAMAAKRWIRANARHLSELPADVAAWAPFEM